MTSNSPSAIEYLMTYGWMLLVVAIVGGAVITTVQNDKSDSGPELDEEFSEELTTLEEATGMECTAYDFSSYYSQVTFDCYTEEDGVKFYKSFTYETGSGEFYQK